MPFTAVTYNTGAAPGIDGPALNALQLQYVEAVKSFQQDLLTPFVFTGFAAAKDGVTFSQLNVGAGTAYIKQTDNTTRNRTVSASTQSTTGHPSATLFLDLNPDGTWSFATTHSAVANYLTIATVTTDSSSNIATITDTRPTATTLLSGMVGALTLPPLTAPTIVGNITGGVGSGIPTTRNGVAQSAGLYTGSNPPGGDGVTTPATGAIWLNK